MCVSFFIPLNMDDAFSIAPKRARSDHAAIDREAVALAAELIRAARECAGLNYMELANRMGAHHFQVRRLENTGSHRKGPTLATLMRVARACNKTLKLTLE
jgi:ribosome-binding protein aMBF1 (putative translation factor)